MSRPPPDPTVTWADPSASTDDGNRALLGERYEDHGLIAEGGMSEVRRVHDRLLDCTVAMKLLAADRVDSPAARARFIAEATATARLSHPGIVAVHDRGERADRRLWYTMTEVRGSTLTDLLVDRTETGGATTRRLVGILVQVCNAVAYAHDQGVVHRDLKPDNLMVGPFGEVLVMDWGIAVDVGTTGDRSGTRGWSAPEQLDGAGAHPTADVWSLGRVLQAAVGHADDALDRLVHQAIAADPSDRPQGAAALARLLQDWLDGAERREQADRMLEEAMAHRPTLDALRAEQAALQDRAQALLDALSADDPVEDKEPAWALEDQAAERAREAAVLEATWLQQLGAVLEIDAEHPGAHRALADHHAAELLRAEGERRQHDALAHEVHLRRHDRGQHAALLRGHGALTLVTQPPGAEVRLFRMVEQARRLVPVFDRALGHTPLVDVTVDRGSWLLELHHPDTEVVRYPVFLGRGESWDGVPPNGDEPFAIPLPRRGSLLPDEVYIPAGWFWCGGDPEAIEAYPRERVWVDGFAVQRFPVTVGDYEAWLADLATTDPELARMRSPRSPASEGPQPLLDDSDGVRLLLPHRHPITAVSWHAAVAFAQYRGARLLDGLEWEKAARGVDGRLFLHGSHAEHGWFNVLDGSTRMPDLEAVGSRPADRSVYGVADLVGNCSEWCANGWRLRAPGHLRLDGEPGDLREIRGASYRHSGISLRSASRRADPPDRRFHSLGFRLARSLDHDA